MFKFDIMSEESADEVLGESHDYTHLLSFRGHGDWPIENFEKVENRIQFNFDDVSVPNIHGWVPPQMKHIEELIEFGRKIPLDANVLFHCQAGIARSTAAAYIIAADFIEEGEDGAKTALSKVIHRRPIARPNTLMVQFASVFLGRPELSNVLDQTRWARFSPYKGVS